MIRKLSSILLFLTILILIYPRQTLAYQNQTDTSFFSLFKNYIIAYTVINAYNNRVLAAQTKAHIMGSAIKPLQPVQQDTAQHISPPNDVSSYILQGVNDYRSSLGLSPVQSSVQTCAFASIRAQEITQGFNHNGFYNRVNNHTIPYSNWARAVENIAQAPDYRQVVTLWKNSPGHAANMRDNTPYVCIMQNGSYYAYEGMRP